jgi:hypothetical protein
MIRKILDFLNHKEERINRIGRDLTLIMDGGWEVTGRIIEYTKADILIETDGRVLRLKRSKIVGETVSSAYKKISTPLDGAEMPGYNIGGALPAAPLPAVARTTAQSMNTPLQKLLAEAEMKSRSELNGNGTHERAQYGTIIPDDMLLPDEQINERNEGSNIDFGITFG